MADAAPTADARARPSVLRSASLVVAFGVGGAVWGVVARAWMRLITDDPEFSWSGTLFIIGLFAVVALAQGCALTIRRRGWPGWAQAPVRAGAAVIALLLGAGAGIVMLPTLVCAPLALGRTGWHRIVRLVLAGIAGVNVAVLLVLLLGELPWVQALVGWVVMLIVYGVIVATLSLNLRPAGSPLVRSVRWPRSTGTAARRSACEPAA